MDSESTSFTVASPEAIATADGGVGVFSALDCPGKLANFLFAGTYSQASPLLRHLMHMGRSPLHLDLDTWHWEHAKEWKALGQKVTAIRQGWGSHLSVHVFEASQLL